MGNCVFKGFGEAEEVVKVVTSNGGIMELLAPITVNCITNEFPGHAIFRSRDLFSEPLLHSEELHPGELYYLLPLNPYNKTKTTTTTTRANSKDPEATMEVKGSVLTPYRMSSCDSGQGMNMMRKRAEAEVFPRYNSSGVWKVKLVISPEQLSEILSQDARTEELIESVRTVAKCGNAASSLASSDQLSVSSSWKGSSS
ncbi:uncharacterized protein LOC107423784 [Ziziphus jujuba]|uniref:Uncharacterized protein LOC107423784 n=2 Tax=Ziziphus jujuba TaxID=326968 RepID=A0A6P4A4T1_ZIZJJ|nr:uncharacterized protein LOC107423784 [Ziziphus jujuba]KAH7519410.1 hypothetical protein FEM48_Zijuj08G0033200 [Ziziphus jujuba var. spinosa]